MNIKTTRQKLRERIARETDEFLARGGHIQLCTFRDNAEYMRPVKLQRKRHLANEKRRFKVRQGR